MQFSIFGFGVEPWIFAVFTMGVLGWEVGRLWLALRSELWPFVLGNIYEVDIENHPDSDGDDFFVPRLRYDYYVAGVTYTGKRLAFHPKGAYKREDVTKALKGVVESKKHKVYFHPTYHQLCVLKPGARLWNYIIILVLVMFTSAALYAQLSVE